MNHRYEPQSKLWTTIPQQAAGYYTFRLRSRTPAGLQKASLTNKTGKMTSIIRAKLKDLQSLSEIGKISFIESHGSSAPVADINIYLKKKFNDKGISEELSDPENIYHIIYHNERPAGY